MKNKIFFILMILSGVSVFGQNTEDAARYSQDIVSGTARFSAMGGSFGAIGGDFSSLSTNPAGIGVYSKSEFSLSPNFTSSKTNSKFLGQSTEDYKYNIGLGNLGSVFTYNTGNTDGLISLSFAFGYNKTMNYNRNIIINGTNPNNGLAVYFLNNVGNKAPEDLDPFYEGLAFDSYLIDQDSLGYFPNMALGQDQRKTITNVGSTGNYLFAIGANMNHQLYMGATIGVKSIYYSRVMNHTELSNDNADYVKEFNFHEELETSGMGFDLKLGAIYRPFDFLRIGAAFHLPTYYSMEDEFYNTMTSTLADNTQLDLKPSYNGNSVSRQTYTYNLTTPMKGLFSVALKYKKLGVLNIDYEYVDYTTTRYRNGQNGYDFYDENQDIQANLKAANNLRGGLEIRMNETLLLRAGYALYDSPYKSGHINAGAKTSIISGGFGVKSENMYFDFAYRRTISDEKLILYPMPTNEPIASIANMRSDIMATIGFRF